MLGKFLSKHIFLYIRIMKKCRICSIEKQEVEFEGSSNGKTTNRCKSCKNENTRKLYQQKKLCPEYVSKERERGREKYYRLGQKYKYNKQAQLNWRKKYPEKLEASIKSRNLERKLKRSNLHHWSYNEEHYTDVIELSIKEHNIIHRYMNYDKETFMYRDFNGNLLDTREKHETFIKDALEFDSNKSLFK